ncbi:GH19539 [Drosophila grimshawi]|uniref:GH19539 n=2 Tax=Drosophila grimshawi TaxID=7222 RepID=B4JHB2_DROGR|nr:GH19539 [Drosophila grimshawi]
MAGRHSENLMRHLKRKHPSTYAKALRQKQLQRSAAQNAGPLSPKFKFVSEPQKLLMKSEFNEPGIELDDHGQYESINIVKMELPDELEQSPGQLHDFRETFSDKDGGNNNMSQFIVTSFPDTETTSVNAIASRSSYPATTTPIANPMQVASDDASFLQLLGHKFGKYSRNTKYTVQYHINRILYKADMGCYGNADASILPDV